jgi:hypothetical protein
MRLTDEELARLDALTVAAGTTAMPLPPPPLPGMNAPATVTALVAYRRARLARR